jgi:hypothetical protein
MLNEADNEKLSLLNEISDLSKENYQIKLELGHDHGDRGGSETDRLIEDLAEQLEQEKTAGRKALEENE